MQAAQLLLANLTVAVVAVDDCAALKSAVPSRNSAKEATIQLLSAVLGSVDGVALAVLALDGADAAVLFTVVLVVVVALGVIVACLRTGSVADPTPGSLPRVRLRTAGRAGSTG